MTKNKQKITIIVFLLLATLTPSLQASTFDKIGRLFGNYFTQTEEDKAQALKAWSHAARRGDKATLAKLLPQIDIEARDHQGLTALHGSALNGRLDCVKFLVQNKADIHSKADRGVNALVFAADNGHLDIVKYFAKQGVDIHGKDKNGDTALHKSARWGHLATVQWLVQHKADIHAKGGYGRTALHASASHGHLDCVKWFVEQGVDINAKEDMFSNSALHLSAKNGHLACVQYLVEAGADIDAKNEDSRTALMLSAQKGHLATVQWLVKHNADIKATDIYDNSALHLSINYCPRINFTYADSHLMSIVRDRNNNLNQARLACCKYLVEQGANNLHAKNKYGKTPLDIARAHDNKEVVQLLENSMYTTEYFEREMQKLKIAFNKKQKQSVEKINTLEATVQNLRDQAKHQGATQSQDYSPIIITNPLVLLTGATKYDTCPQLETVEDELKELYSLFKHSCGYAVKSSFFDEKGNIISDKNNVVDKYGDELKTNDEDEDKYKGRLSIERFGDFLKKQYDHLYDYRKEYDALIFIFSGHGYGYKEGYDTLQLSNFYAKDNKPKNHKFLSEIHEKFTHSTDGNYTKDFGNKPKIFFFLACRGDGGKPKTSSEKKAQHKGGTTNFKEAISQATNQVTYFSTIPGYITDVKVGEKVVEFFSKSLKRSLDKKGAQHSLGSIMQEVSFSIEEHNGCLDASGPLSVRASKVFFRSKKN